MSLKFSVGRITAVKVAGREHAMASMLISTAIRKAD
jgi:hypothetical protein